jgi:hypothetical protein
MHVVFGQSLDKASYPGILTGNAASAGKLHLGPAGFLARLEQVLGIPPQSTHQPVRVAQYAKRLAQHDDGQQFYSESRKADPWRVTRKLLGLRDDLVLAGWRGEILEKGGARLRAFAELESLATDYPLAPGQPDRLARVIERLELIFPHIDTLELIDPVSSFPKLWRDVFRFLEGQGTRVHSMDPKASGDLRLAQQALLGKATGKVKGDGSFLRLECKGLMEAAEVTSAVLASLLKTKDSGSIVMIRDGDQRESLVLEKTLQRFDIPSAGLTLESSHRPATQILPLFLGLAWEPVDPDLLVEFLTLPSSPVPARAREAPRQALNQSPGYESQAWKRARQDAVKNIQARNGNDQAEETDRRLKEWLDDIVRIPVSREMPISYALRLTRQVEDWANSRAYADEAEPFFFQAKEQASVMCQLLDLHPRESIGRAELGRLLYDVMQTGISYELSRSEQGSFKMVSSPAAIFGSVPVVVWWQCVGASAAVPPPLFWTQEEVDTLRKDRCDLLSPTALLLEHARAWRRAVLHATERVLLVQPEQAFGEPQESHPIWNEIAMRIAPKESEQLKMTATADTLLEGTHISTERVSRARSIFPAPKRTWELPVAHLGARETESPTSLETLLGCPLRWVLQYKARLREPLIEVITERQLLYGNLAHRIVGEYLTDFVGKPLPRPSTVPNAIAQEFDRRVASEAATLIKPGMDRERTNVRNTLSRAAGVLVGLLDRGGYRIESIEEEHSDSFALGTIQGRTDLIVRRQKDGMKAVIDLKWSSDKGKIEALKNGTALQLAVYSYFSRTKDRWPSTAYFVFPSAQLFATNDQDFPGCTLIPGPTEKEMWNSALLSIGKVRGSLDKGWVDVPWVDSGEEVAETEAGMHLEPPCTYCNFQIFCRYA